MHHNLIIKDGDTTKVVKEVLVDGIQFVDEAPREGSTNFVTSDGVKGAIDGAVGDASEALQEQIDDIAEKAGSGYIPKGEADVATLNGLSGQENGWLYTMTDAGTLTDGSLAVSAGDSVAWDATNSKWYKVSQYALKQYGTDEIHNLSTNATEADIVGGNYVPLDGSAGTKKIPSDLFAKSSEVGKNVSVAGTLATTYDFHIVRVRGKIGDVVSLDYTASQNSNLVVTPEGGSASVLINQARSGHYNYVLTTASADFGFFGAVGVDYTLSAKSGLKLDIDTLANDVSNFKKSNLKKIYSGSLATTYDYKIAYVEGNVGDKVLINYTTSLTSNLVVIPQGGSATILKTGGTGGSVEYTMTASSATFGVFGSVGMTYSITIEAGLIYAIEKTNAFAQEVNEKLSLDESSNLKKTYSGTLATTYDYKIVFVEGNIGDKVYIDYTTSLNSNFVAFPVGGSPTIIVNGGGGKKLEYTLTSTKVSFGVYGSVGMTYSITIEAGVSYQIKSTRHELGNADVYTGTISSYNYNIAKIEGDIGEKVLIKFETSAGANLVIGNTSVRSGTFGWYEYTLTSLSIGVGFYVTSETNYTLEIRRGVAGNVASLMESTSILKTKNLLILGDSISTSPYYYKYLMKEFSACRNVAVVSATWADRNNTDAYDGNPTQDVAKSNVMGNQVQKVKNTLSSYVPDVILLAAGTNDSDYTSATLNESLFTDSNGFVSMGTPTFDSSDTYMANRRTMAGAMRYCITELEKLYPNAQIFICTPIQSSQSIHQYANTKNKQDLQKAVGQRMSVNVIDVGGGCGIYGDFEYLGSSWTEQEPDSHAGRDLYDGLHPNNNGSQKMSKYIYNEILRMLKK